MIEITNLKYDKGHFSCIADLVEDDDKIVENRE